MDVHRDGQAVEAPQNVDPLGQIQRRPLPDIALNIDRHEPQLERGAGPDRGPQDRDRRFHQQEQLEREDPRELARHLPRQLSQPERPAMVNTAHDIASSFVTVVAGLTLSIFILFMYLIGFYVEVLLNGSHFDHWNTTQTNAKTSLSHVSKLVAIYEFIYACSIVARVLCFYKYSAQMALYRYISLGLYATALFLALTSGHVIYELINLGLISQQSSSADEMLICRISIYTLCFSVQYQMVVGSLGEWLVGLVLYFVDSQHKAIIPWTAIISGTATLWVNVCVIKIYSIYKDLL